MVELERIEVLKGPQGTLFGKNAMGGAISYVSRPPAEELGARLSFSMGNFNQRQIRANVDVPITQNFLTKFSIFTNQKDGYVQSGNAQIQQAQTLELQRLGGTGDLVSGAGFGATSVSQTLTVNTNVADRVSVVQGVAPLNEPWAKIGRAHV